MSIQVNPTISPRIITVPEADGDSITVQSLLNQCRDWEDNQINLGYPRLIRATGKDEVETGEFTGITAVLENTLLTTDERYSLTIFSVGGGNLLAEDASGDKVYPFSPAINVSFDRAKSLSPAGQYDVINTINNTIALMLAETPGTFTPSTDSLEAIRDRGDIAWTGGGRRGIFK